MLEELAQSIDINSLHHAYLLEGNSEVVLPNLLIFFENANIAIHGNPDLIIEKYSTFTIENGRQLKARQGERAIGSGTSIQSGKKFFIIQTDFFNSEAQQALLKVFEEPAQNVHFFIIVPRIGALLETLASRLVHIRSTEENKSTKAGSEFLAMKKPARLKHVASLIKAHENDDEFGALRAQAVSLLNSIEFVLHEGGKMSILTDTEKMAFQQIGKSREYLQTPGASVKMLLESVALLMPEK